MVMDLNCLTVPSARLIFAEFLVWLALPALSSAPHFDGHQFSVHGASLTGPFNGCPCAIAEPANAASTTPVTIDSFIATPSRKDSEYALFCSCECHTKRRLFRAAPFPSRDRRITPQPYDCCKV